MTPLCLQKPGLRELYRRHWPRDLILQKADKRKSRHQVKRRGIRKPALEGVSRRSEDPVPDPWGTGDRKSLLSPPTPRTWTCPSLHTDLSHQASLSAGWGRRGPADNGKSPLVLPLLKSSVHYCPGSWVPPSVSAKHTIHTSPSLRSKQAMPHSLLKPSS